MKLTTLLTTAALLPLTIAYTQADLASLNRLSADTSSAADSITSLCGCGFASTTQALAANAPVANGAACASADSTITHKLTTLNSQGAAVVHALQSPSAPGVSNADMANAFHTFAKATVRAPHPSLSHTTNSRVVPALERPRSCRVHVPPDHCVADTCRSVRQHPQHRTGRVRWRAGYAEHPAQLGRRRRRPRAAGSLWRHADARRERRRPDGGIAGLRDHHDGCRR